MDDCVAAMQQGKADELLDRYFSILEKNGDPTPTKKTKGQVSIRKEGEREGYHEARVKHIMEDAGYDRAEAEKAMSTLDKFFEGGPNVDTPTIDKYVDHAPAYDGIIYRGLAWDRGSESGGYDEFIKNIQPGADFGMNGNASSWSSNEEVSRGFAHHGDNSADSVMLVCVNNRTSTPVDHLSTYGESEVLASSKARWTVLHSETATWDSGARKTWVYVMEKGENA